MDLSTTCYVILDIFSRYVVGWMVATGETAALARSCIADDHACEAGHHRAGS